MHPRPSSAHQNRIIRRFASGLAIAAIAAVMFVACTDRVTDPVVKAHAGTLAAQWQCYSEVVDGYGGTIFINGEFQDFEIVEWYYDENANVTFITICVNWTDPPDPPDPPDPNGGGYDCFSMPWMPGCEPPPPPPPPCYPSCGGGDPGGNNPLPPPDSLSVSVSADSTSVAFGSTITATASVTANNGGAYAPDGWSWSGSPGTSCTTALTCEMRVTATGWMRFDAHKNAVTATDSVQITVAPPRLRLTCNGDTTQVSVTRAANLGCTAESTSGGTVTTVAWEFSSAVGTLTANTLGSENPLSGPAVITGTLTVNGTIDSVTATAASIAITVIARPLTSFQWLPPVTTASVPAQCGQGYFDTYWGWTAVANTCESFRVLSPSIDNAGGGVVAGEVLSGPNRSLHYVSSWSAGVNVGSDYIAEVKGGGANYTLFRSDPIFGQCIAGAQSSIQTQLAPINMCTAGGRTPTPVTAVGAALNAHEACHRMYSAQAFNNLNSTPGSAVQKVPSAMESALGRSAAELRNAWFNLLSFADNAIINVGSNALDHFSGNAPVPMWGPPGQNYTNWGDVSWPFVYTC